MADRVGSFWTAENDLSERCRGPVRAKVSEDLLTTSHAGERPGDGVFEYAEREIDVLNMDRMGDTESLAVRSMWSCAGWKKLREGGFKTVDDWEGEDSRKSKDEV